MNKASQGTKQAIFAPLNAQNGRHPAEVECRLFCCPILLGRCRFCSFLKLLSYRHTAECRCLFFSVLQAKCRAQCNTKAKTIEATTPRDNIPTAQIYLPKPDPSGGAVSPEGFLQPSVWPGPRHRGLSPVRTCAHRAHTKKTRKR